MLRYSYCKKLTPLSVNNYSLIANNAFGKRFYSRNNQDDDSKDYEKNMNEMINQVNEELMSERMDVNNKFLQQKLEAEEELKQKKLNTHNRYTTYKGTENDSKPDIGSKFEPDRSKSYELRKKLLNQSMNYKLWVLAGILLVGVVGGNDIYNYFVHQEQFVEMGENIKEVQNKKIAKKQDKLERRLKKLNETLNSADSGVISWEKGNFSVMLSEFVKKQGLIDVVEDSVNKKLFLLARNGDLYEFSKDSKNINVILKGLKLNELKLSNQKLYIKDDKNEIIVLPVNKETFEELSLKRSILKPWFKYTNYDNKIKNSEGKVMKFVDFDLGETNFVGQTEDGLVYSATTLSKQQQFNQNFNKGQFGLPDYPPSKLVKFAQVQKADIEEYPCDDVEDWELLQDNYDNKLLEEDLPYKNELITSSYFSKSNKIVKRNIMKLSSGKNHSYFVDSNSTILAYGDNSVGQIYLQKINTMKGYPVVLSRLPNSVKCLDVYCIEDNTYFVVEDVTSNNKNQLLLLSCGSGNMGELANGQFKINQADATKFVQKSLDNIKSVKKLGGLNDKRYGIFELSNGDYKLCLWGNNNDGNLPGVMAGKRYNQVQEPNISLKKDKKVLITENFGTLIY
ncbi:Fmp25 protein [Hanseniaspora uvarum]|nr:Fmp25 protein [Hanseniaspora uvarum]